SSDLHHGARHRRRERTADVNRLAGGFAVEGDLNDLVFDVVSIVVHLELIENVRIERGGPSLTRAEKSAGIHDQHDSPRGRAGERVHVGEIHSGVEFHQRSVLVVRARQQAHAAGQGAGEGEGGGGGVG